MPETPNDMEGILECHHSCSENAEYVWQNIDFNIVFEVYCRLKDGDQYFIDKYIRRFDSFMQLVSRNEYKDVIPLLFHRPPYNMGLVDSLSIECFSILRISEYPNTSLEMIFRMTKGLDTSLRRNPIYIRDYVDHNASLIWAYETLIASPDLGPAYQAISTEVEKMLTDGITIGKE
jgi:hypothetical protein